MICRDDRRCKKHLYCLKCGEIWRSNNFRRFATSYKYDTKDIITYSVLSFAGLDNLSTKLDNLFQFIAELRELKKRGRVKDFYLRLEVSHSDKLGYHPHINIITFGDFHIIKSLGHSLGLKIWSRTKTNSKNIVLSLVWYILKYNPIGYDNGRILVHFLNKRRTILHTKRFDCKDDLIPLDYIFMGTNKVRDKEEVQFRHNIKLKRQTLSKELRQYLANKQH